MKLYRCQSPECSDDSAGRLRFDFETADDAPPTCPKCSIDARSPEGRGLIVKRETIHFHIVDPQGPDVGRGKRYRIACIKGGSRAGRRATGEASSVTCHECKMTTEYKAAALECNLCCAKAECDFPIEVNIEKAILCKVEDK